MHIGGMGIGGDDTLFIRTCQDLSRNLLMGAVLCYNHPNSNVSRETRRTL